MCTYPPMLQNDPLKLPPFHFDADSDPAYHFDADPVFHFDADPDPASHKWCGTGSATLVNRLQKYIQTSHKNTCWLYCVPSPVPGPTEGSSLVQPTKNNHCLKRQTKEILTKKDARLGTETHELVWRGSGMQKRREKKCRKLLEVFIIELAKDYEIWCMGK